MLRYGACYRIVSSSLPKGAKYIGVMHDQVRDSLLICFEHDSFEDVPQGHCLPVMHDITIETVQKRYFERAKKCAARIGVRCPQLEKKGSGGNGMK